MKLRLSGAFLLVGLMLSMFAFAAQAQDFKALMQKTMEAWGTLDPSNAAPFYAQEADRVFYDLAPFKYTGWAEYAEGVKKVFADYASIKFTLGQDARVIQRGNFAWGTATLHADAVKKDGSKEVLDARWTVVWEKRGKAWLIVHEHVSVPLAALEDKSGQSLYKRLGGYDALAAVVDDFLGRLVNAPQLHRFFAGHSTDSKKRTRQLLVDQLCAATGGPCVYIGRGMKTAHAGLGISENDWQAAVNHLVSALDKFKVPGKEKDEVLATLSALKKDIVGPTAGGQE